MFFLRFWRAVKIITTLVLCWELKKSLRGNGLQQSVERSTMR